MAGIFSPPAPAGSNYTSPNTFPGPGGFGNILLEDNPRGAWQQLLDMLLGVRAGTDSKSQFYQQQYDPWRNRYLATAAERNNPSYGWLDFLKEYQPSIEGMYDQTTSPQQRGENPGRYIGPVRYVGFPG